MQGQALYTFLKKSLFPLIAFSCAGMALCGLWVSVADAPSRAGIGLLGILTYWILFPLLLVPAGMAARIMIVMEQQMPRLSKCMAVVSAGWVFGMLSLYMTFSLHFAGTTLAGYAFGLFAGIAPWALLTLKDRDNAFFIGVIWTCFILGAVAGYVRMQMGYGFWQTFGILAAMMWTFALIQSRLEKRLT